MNHHHHPIIITQLKKNIMIWNSYTMINIIILVIFLWKQQDTYAFSLLVPQLQTFHYLGNKPLAKIKDYNQVYSRPQPDRFHFHRTSSIIYSGLNNADSNLDLENDDDDEDIFFEKFQLDDDIITDNHSDDHSDDHSEPTIQKKDNIEDETKIKIEQQQKQIDMLMEMMRKQSTQQQQQTSQPQQRSQQQNSKDDSLILPPPLPGMFDNHKGEDELQGDADNDTIKSLSSFPFQSSSSSKSDDKANGVIPLAPLKVMLFIDGTWLYYSLHRRKEDRDPIVKKFGRGWQHRYKFDWNALPRIICEELVGQQKNLGWSASSSASMNVENNNSFNGQRPMEIVRASVFTSYKKTTDPNSFRVKMYNEMANANYDLHMLESVGNGPEKCVDISLAVEMLHYATVPNAYDVAILLSGDKDFIPALVRTRQKGRKVGIVSMRTGCNRALYESPHIKDFNVVWIDDFLDDLLVPLPPDEINSVVESVHDRGLLSAFTITKVIYDFIHNSPFDKVSSRDIGRYLKGMEINDGTTLLDDVKLGQGGLRRFLQDRMSNVFDVIDKTSLERMNRDSNDKSYWISIKSGATDILLMEAKMATFTDEERQFLKDYQSKFADGDDLKEESYFYTIESTSENINLPKQTFSNDIDNVIFNERLDDQEELSRLTVTNLKEICREYNLPVSGTKSVLIERIEQHQREQQKNNDDISTVGSFDEYKGGESKYLEDLVKYYVTQNGGYVSSRDLGRFLASNKPYKSDSISALQQLKDMFGGVASFLNQRSDLFVTTKNQDPAIGDASNSYSFGIALRESNPKSIKSVPSNSRTKPQFQQYSNDSIRSRPKEEDSKVSDYIESLIREYLQARGGLASSRDIGRYLVANSAYNNSKNNSFDTNGRRMTALQQLKDNYGSLASYLSGKESVFTTVSGNMVDSEMEGQSRHEFGVKLR